MNNGKNIFFKEKKEVTNKLDFLNDNEKVLSKMINNKTWALQKDKNLS